MLSVARYLPALLLFLGENRHHADHQEVKAYSSLMTIAKHAKRCLASEYIRGIPKQVMKPHGIKKDTPSRGTVKRVAEHAEH